MVSMLLHPSQCVLIPLTCAAPGTNIPPLPPATNAATAAITSARCCLYHSFSSQPPPSPFLRVQSALHLSSSLVLLFTLPFQAQPPFHDDPNTPHTPLLIPLRRMSPRARQNTWPANSSRGTSSQHTTPICIAFLDSTQQRPPHNTLQSTTHRWGRQATIWAECVLKCTMTLWMQNGTCGNLQSTMPQCIPQELGLPSAARRDMSFDLTWHMRNWNYCREIIARGTTLHCIAFCRDKIQGALLFWPKQNNKRGEGEVIWLT